MNGELFAKCGCRHCGNHIEFPLDASGTTINCPHCNQPTELDLTPPPAVHFPNRPSAAELLAAFGGSIPRAPVSFFYRLGLALVSVMMIFLPVVYLAMIFLAGWGVYLYASHFSNLLKPMRGGSRIFVLQLALYFVPLFIGVVLVFFMIKPLFARRPPHAQPLAMNPGVESTLYAFIARVCELIGAPMPARIDLDCELNASAGFRRGAASLLTNDLVLTIGLPLVANLNLREFAGIVAHEFGHFTQGFAMRLSYVIRAVNGWFARVVYERDAWDVALETWSTETEDWRVTILVGMTQAAVGFARWLLMLLMFLGHGVSCFLLRQMEYDADRCAIKLAGSATVESTARRLAVLGQSLQRAYKEMEATWNLNGNLPDDFPAFLADQDARLAPAAREKIQDTMGLERTRLFDTHPSDGDRIRRARQSGEPGVFHLDAPASVLFSNFEIVSKQVTQLHYAEDLGIDFDVAALRPVRPRTVAAGGRAAQ